jgi:queuine/archaeosine tRNA-ribosyltransferase
MASLSQSYAFVPVIHGYTLKDLRNAVIEIKEIVKTPAIIGLGSMVPLMKGSYLGKEFKYQRENGDYGDHVDFIGDALKLMRSEFPNSFLHVFGVGGITTILAMFALGADSVDSVAWRLKAAYGAIQLPGISDRFLSPRPNSLKIRKVLDRQEEQSLSKCDCPVCWKYQRLEWQKKFLDKNFIARTIHNSWIFLKEVNKFRIAVTNQKGHKIIKSRLNNSHRLSRLFADGELKGGING